MENQLGIKKTNSLAGMMFLFQRTVSLKLLKPDKCWEKKVLNSTWPIPQFSREQSRHIIQLQMNLNLIGSPFTSTGDWMRDIMEVSRVLTRLKQQPNTVTSKFFNGEGHTTFHHHHWPWMMRDILDSLPNTKTCLQMPCHALSLSRSLWIECCHSGMIPYVQPSWITRKLLLSHMETPWEQSSSTFQGWVKMRFWNITFQPLYHLSMNSTRTWFLWRTIICWAMMSWREDRRP